MPIQSSGASVRRRSVNLTIREDVIEAAKLHGLNTSQAAEAGIVQAIKDTQTTIGAHNARIEKEGPLLTSDWTTESRHGPVRCLPVRKQGAHADCP